MTLAEFREQRERRSTEAEKRAWVQEASDPDSLPEGMTRFTVYECVEPGLYVIVERYLDLELIYDQSTDMLHDAEELAVHRTDPIAEFDAWPEAVHNAPMLPPIAAALAREYIV